MAVDPDSEFNTTPVQPEDWVRIVVTLLFSLALVGFLAIYSTKQPQLKLMHGLA